MKQTGPLFWQPRKNYLKIISRPCYGWILILLNYAIWLFLFFISFLLIKNDINAFWQLLIATTIAELIERQSKKRPFWQRPLYKKNKKVPKGLVRSWYNTGSFPSGHTTKAVYFFLFVLQYQVISPESYLLISLPLIFFRVLVGFHYPIDILGGLLIGPVIWFFSQNITPPVFLTNITKSIFDIIFFIK